MSPSMQLWLHKWHKIKQNIKTTKKKEKAKSLTEITVEQQQEELLDIIMAVNRKKYERREEICFRQEKQTKKEDLDTGKR